jgi:Xaa-Pro aminopeptidase
MKSFFTTKFFANNRQRLLEATESDCIVLSANGLIQRGADSTFPFQQDANFWYLTGLNEPDLTLAMTGSEVFLIVPPRSTSRQAFDGSISLEQLTQRSGISNVYEGEAGWQRLEKIINKQDRIGIVNASPAYIETYGFYANPARAQLQSRLEALKPGIEFEDVGPFLRTHRSIKQPAELKAMQSAIDITIESLNDSVAAARQNSAGFEYELEAMIAAGFRKRGARGHAFEPIVAAGKQACTLHYVANISPINKQDFVILDVGAEVEQYAADISRTINFSKPTKRQSDILDAVTEVQSYALDLLKPGVLIKEYEQAVHDFMGKKLQELKLITSLDTAEVRRYYPHATSHFLGLNVHDVGNYDQPLEPNMVVTVEPGIYVPEEGIGVRIEDDVLITKTGTKVLSNKLPTRL